MLAHKIIKCKIIELTNSKRYALDSEYNNMQIVFEFIRHGVHELADKVEVSSFTKSINLWKDHKGPSVWLRNDSIKLGKGSTRITSNWIKISVKAKRGGIWLPVKPHEEIPSDVKIADSQLIKKGDDYWIHLVIKKEVPEISCSNAIAIDLGERFMATVCGSSFKQPLFYGRDVRGIRRHYAWLRKRLGNKKLPKKIKLIGQKEQRKVDELLHNISKEIVDLAVTTNSQIFIGDLKNLSESAQNKGKRMRRIVGNMPYSKLTKMIEYKAGWQGIPVTKVSEKYTSKNCSRCGEEGKRVNQGLFKCPSCKYQVNADFNGSKNILNRGLKTISSQDGAIASGPQTAPDAVSA